MVCCSIIPSVVLLEFIELVRSWDGTGVIHRCLFGGSIVWHNNISLRHRVQTGSGAHQPPVERVLEALPPSSKAAWKLS
jgi:hypothetical protein